MKIYEIRIKSYILVDIPASKVQCCIAEFIDSALAEDKEFLEFHRTNKYKNYSYGGFYPIEKKGVYSKGNIYTITIRTVDVQLARYFSTVLKNHYTSKMKGLTVENRLIPKKIIGELYTLTPAIIKTDQGYWKDRMTLEEFEKRLMENAIKKYNAFTGTKIEEGFQLYTNIRFLNRKPIANEYKGIRLLGDKIELKIADNARAQDLAYFLLGAGICELNARGMGYCNFKWI